MAAMTTTVAAFMGSLSWVLLDYYRAKKIFSLGYCSGLLAGLVAITPACGFVSPWAAIIIGILAGLFSNVVCHGKNYFGYDDSMDVFGIHGASGFLGLVLTGVFGSASVAAMDGTIIPGGWIDGNWKQVGIQLAGASVITVWSFLVTLILAFIFSKIPALSLRCSPDDEKTGLDHVAIGEAAYELIQVEESRIEADEKESIVV